ncbi:protein kinase [Streptomyces mutabilis]|uniref:serine/threonine-protein kinase n=1 Tax=Streptomyces mutabilis TaxID=67332 RepID=UPI0017826DE4|nr:serine/threonine-protein kinase [Streptomyces mutabilis]GGQ28976.1 serine/threonine protein kinase [Streptomyces mutabilis]
MGEVFAGRYELVDPVGRGGVGAVWRAWDHRRRRYVAAKVLQQRDAHALLRFVREQALRIDHPNVLAPASWAADDDQVLFTMDLVAGGSLVHLVGDYGPLPPAFVCTLVDQLLAGLAAVHAEGVVHRDIKPANLLLEATGTGRPRLRLSDFGIAMRLGEPRLTETNLVVGTPGYLAPEQMMGAEPDFPADLFAVGLVALYLLEGAKPDAKALVQYFAEHGTPPAPQGVPAPLWQVVSALVQPDPAARFRTATGARKALAAAAELLPEPGPDDELIEIFDQVGPLPAGFTADGPLERASGLDPTPTAPRDVITPPTVRPVPALRSDTPPAPGPGATPSAGSPAPASPSGPQPAPEGAPAGAAGASGTTPSAGYRAPDSPDGPQSPPGRTPPSSPGAALPAHGTQPSPPGSLPAPAPEAPRPADLSETGSFRLPPPQAAVTAASVSGPHPGSRREQGPYHGPPFPAQPLPAPSVGQRDADATTASYTARNPQGPAPASPPPSPFEPAPAPAPAVTGPQHRAARRRRRRTGPPAGVAVAVLLLALVCYAVGFWALARL